MTEVDAEFAELFREETQERLDRIVEILLAVEAGTPPADGVDALFREFHTIKGAAGMLGLDEIRTLAHAVEDLLADAREQGDLPPDLVEPLLAAADALRAQLRGDPDAAHAALLDQLTAHRARPEPAAAAAEAADAPAAPPPPAEAPARSIRVPARKLDRVLDLVGETVLHRRRLEHELARQGRREQDPVQDELHQGGQLLEELQGAAVTMRTVPVASILGPLPRAVRDLAKAQGKEVEIEVTGAETELDRVILEGLAEPVTHLLRNAVSHGIEPPTERERRGKPRRGRVRLHAEQRGAMVAVGVTDDGQGVSQEVVREAAEAGSLADVLTRPGFSTAAEVSDVAGRGVGLDAVKRHVESLGGSLEADSEPGAGTTVTLLLPLTLALLNVLLVERAGQVFALPLPSVQEAVPTTDALWLAGRRHLEVRGDSLVLADLADVVGVGDAVATAPHAPALVVTGSLGRIALLCDRLLGQEDVVVKPLGPVLAHVEGYLGAAVLGDGRVALILDPARLATSGAAERPRVQPVAPRSAADRADQAPAADVPPKLLVVEDSFTVREVQRSLLEAAGYRVETARDGREGLERLRGDGDIALVVTDLEMPELDGFGLLEAIRSDPDRAALPVVVVTTRAAEEDRQRGLAAGADAYVVKGSFDQGALLETIERLIGR